MSREKTEIMNAIVNDCGKAPCTECMWCDHSVSAHAEALYNAGYRKQSEVIKEFVKRFERYIGNCTFTMGQTYDIQYALKKATEEMDGERKEQT